MCIFDYCKLKVNTSLCVNNFDFKILFLVIEVGMRFKALHNESNIRCFKKIYQRWKMWLLQIIVRWKYIHYFACGLETPLNKIEQNLAHTWIMDPAGNYMFKVIVNFTPCSCVSNVNFEQVNADWGKDETWIQKP